MNIALFSLRPIRFFAEFAVAKADEGKQLCGENEEEANKNQIEEDQEKGKVQSGKRQKENWVRQTRHQNSSELIDQPVFCRLVARRCFPGLFTAK